MKKVNPRCGPTPVWQPERSEDSEDSEDLEDGKDGEDLGDSEVADGLLNRHEHRCKNHRDDPAAVRFH